MEYSNASHNSFGHLETFMSKVYGWVSVAMVISGTIAYGIASKPLIVAKISANPWLFFGLCIGELILVIALSSSQVFKFNYATVVALFVGYSCLTGFTLSVIFFVYTLSSIAQTFFVTAGTFGLMALYGYYTRSDLTKMGSFLVMGLFGLIIAMVINIFWGNAQLDLLISIIGILIFIGLTAFDVQKIKQLGIALNNDQVTMSKITISCALTLYLDFLNLFLFLLRFMGRQRD